MYEHKMVNVVNRANGHYVLWIIDMRYKSKIM